MTHRSDHSLDQNAPLWAPAPAQARQTQLYAFYQSAARQWVGTPTPDAPYSRWHDWSCDRPEQFWATVWDDAGVLAESRGDSVLPWDDVLVGGARMAPPSTDAGPSWFPGARLNFAENLLRHRGPELALIFRDERGRRRTITRDALVEQVAALAATLHALGVRPGDRVAGFLPNIPEAVTAMLAAAACGAVWSSCSPDFGAKGVLDRFGQITPRVLFAADGYTYAGKAIDLVARVADIAEAIPELEHVVLIPFLRDSIDAASIAAVRGGVRWSDCLARSAGAALHCEQLPFNHPLYVMYSSGTTGLPKCMVHGAGGTLLQHLKEHRLHVDLRAGERIFYFTTCGWMMWNWLVSALATGATVVLYDGSPMPPSQPDALWTLAAEEHVSVFGTSAKFLAMSEKEGMQPARTHDLSVMRTILSTGSPLAEHSYDFVYRSVRDGVHLASISGGTDLISCFALGNPTLPVWRGELQCRGLGMAVDVFDAAGHSVSGEAGELVCTKPFPSMPVAFWNDADGAAYRAAYFDHYPNVWRHGDWAAITAHDGLVIYGRSDATLNPGGVRIGTAEIYRQVEQLEEILESVVVGQEIVVEGSADVRIVLFVRLRAGAVLNDALRDTLRRRIREAASPHHVPKVIVQVADIPRTISGKITEMAVRDVIHGRVVKNTDALANPAALDLYRNLPELRLS